MLHKASPTWTLMFLLGALTGAAQDTQEQAPPQNPDTAALSEEFQARRPPTLKALPRSILTDQKYLWLRPLRMERNEVPLALGVVGVTAGAMAIDRPVAQKLTDSPPGAGYAFSRRVGQLSGWPADFGIAGTFYLFGYWKENERARATGLLSLRAVADSLVVVQALKAATQRPRPADDDGYPNHHAIGEFFAGGNSFPSGHSAQAWALATVIAHQYWHRRWVPWTAYSLAGFVAVSRVTARKHFPSDVVVGSTLGHLIGRHVVSSAVNTPGTERRWNLVPQPAPGGGAAVSLVFEF